MGCYIALLRAINVGGRNRLAMPELKALFARLGFKDARSWLQSGNFVFQGGTDATGELERLFEAETEKHFGARIDYFVRTAEEWREVLAHNPFAREAKADPSHLVVLALKDAPDKAQLRALKDAIKGRETVEIWTRHAFAFYPEGIGDSKMTPRLIEDRLGTRATGRNWTTSLKLQTLADA